jgi:hypothetical protein
MIATLLCVAALAVAQAPAAPVDITQSGPLSRKITKEDREGIDALFKAADAAWKKGDMESLTALYEFPIYMATDTKDGTFQGGEWSVEQFQKIMGGFMKSDPKDVVYKEKLTPHFLSDTMASVIVETTATRGGKELGSYKSSVLVIKKNGQWRFKSGAEAGHGGLP